MSTATTPTAAVPETSSRSGVPFGRLVQVELRKSADTLAGRWLLIAIAAITALIVVIFFLTADADQRVFSNFVGVTATPQGFLLPVLGILLVTSEWSQRTGLVTFTLEPRRVRVLAAKVVAALLLGLAAIVVALAIAAIATLLGGSSSPWDIELSGIGKFVLLEELGILQGLGFGLLLLSSAAAIVLYFVLPTAMTIVAGLWSALRDAQPWIDINTASSPLFDSGALTGQEWAQLASAAAIWIVLPLAVGTWRLLRSEVK